MAIQEKYWETKPPLNHFYSNSLLTIEQRDIPESVAHFLKPWLKERSSLIQSWHHVLDNAIKQQSVERAVQELCQRLMDYVSAGHFEIYEKLLEEAKAFNDSFIKFAEPIYQNIGVSTERALRFNEKYATGKSYQLRRKQLPFELSKLGEALEERFEAEDQLVKFFNQLHHQ